MTSHVKATPTLFCLTKGDGLSKFNFEIIQDDDHQLYTISATVSYLIKTSEPESRLFIEPQPSKRWGERQIIKEIVVEDPTENQFTLKPSSKELIHKQFKALYKHGRNAVVMGDRLVVYLNCKVQTVPPQKSISR